MLLFVGAPVRLCLVDGLFERPGGVGALGDIHQELIQLGPHLLVDAKPGVQVLVVAEHLDLVLHDGGGVDLGVADTLGVLDIVVPCLRDGHQHVGVLQVLHIEHQVLGPPHLTGKLDLVVHQQVPAVQLVPQHPVKIRGRLVHQMPGKLVLGVDPGGQETVFPHLRGPGNTHHAQIVLQLFQHLLGLCGPGGDHHLVRCDDQVGVVLFGNGDQMLGEVRVDIVVAVHELHILAAGQLQAQVAGVGHAGVGLVHQHDALVLCAERFAHGQALILGAIVQDDEFNVFIGLVQDAADAAGQMILGVVYGQDDGKEQQVLDEKWITDFAEAICAKREYHIRWNYSVEKEEQDYLVYITGEWEEMKVPLTIRISPLVYDAAKPEKQELQSVFFEKKCAAYQHFPVETYLAEQLFTILKYLELIPSMEVYDTTFRLLKQETVDGRHIYETLSFFCEKEEVIPQEKRIEMLASYETYTYMKKRWEKYIRKQGTEDVSWETVLHRIIAFLSPVWNAMCRDEVFFGDWMPDLERYL